MPCNPPSDVLKEGRNLHGESEMPAAKFKKGQKWSHSVTHLRTSESVYFLKDARTNAVLRFRKESFAGNKLSGNRRKAVPALRGDSRFRLWESRLDSVAVNPRSWDEVNQLILQITSTILN